MRFITEEDIRDIYKATPFTVYESLPGTRLTPGARQWLMDRGLIDLEYDPREAGVTHGVTVSRTARGRLSGVARGNGCDERIGLLIETLIADYFKTALALERAEVDTAKRIISLAEQLAKLRDGANIREKPGFCECTGIKKEDFSKLLEDCFEITGCHAGGPNGEEIISLHLLRCKTRLVERAARDAKEVRAKAGDTDALVEGLRQMINTLSRMVCASAGNKVCMKGRFE